MVAATPQLLEIERFSHISPDGQRRHSRRFVHRRYALLDIGEKSSRCGFADCKEMRFRGAFKERDKCRCHN